MNSVKIKLIREGMVTAADWLDIDKYCSRRRGWFRDFSTIAAKSALARDSYDYISQRTGPWRKDKGSRVI